MRLPPRRDASTSGRGCRRPPGYGDLTAVRRGQVFALDGSAYFSRPGPRVIDGIELLAEIFDPEAFVDIAPIGSWTPVGAVGAGQCRSARRSTCLWCGAAHACRGPDDLEGWAQLCPDCVGKAGDNGFLRFRLRQALTERGAAGGSVAVGRDRGGPRPTARAADRAAARRARPPPTPTSTPRCSPTTRRARPSTTTGTCAAAATNAARSTTRPGTPSSTSPAGGSTRCPSRGEIVELAAGTGWWSPLLASKGELSLYDAAPAPLDRARERLVAHRSARAPPRARRLGRARPRGRRGVHRVLAEPRPARAARRLPGDRPALAQARRDRSRSSTRCPDPQSSAADHPTPADDASRPPPRRRPRVHGRQGLLRARRARGRAREPPVSSTSPSPRPAGSS